MNRDSQARYGLDQLPNSGGGFAAGVFGQRSERRESEPWRAVAEYVHGEYFPLCFGCDSGGRFVLVPVQFGGKVSPSGARLKRSGIASGGFG